MAHQRAAAELVAPDVQEEPHRRATQPAGIHRPFRLAPGSSLPPLGSVDPDAGADGHSDLVHEGCTALSGLGAGGSARGLSPAVAGVGTADSALCGADQHPAALRAAVLLGLVMVL